MIPVNAEGAHVSVPTPVQQTYLNTTTTTAPPRSIPPGAENAHVSVPLNRTLTSDPCASPSCVVDASRVELFYFPPTTTQSGVAGSSNGTEGGLGSIAISNGYTL